MGTAPAPRPVAFGGDDDDLDMEIERNLVGTSLPTATSSRTSSGAPAAGRSARPVASTGLEVAHVRAGTRGHVADSEDEPGVAVKILGLALTGLVMGGAVYTLLRFVHRKGGLVPTNILPHAFDGTSAPESGVVALASLAISVALGFAGVRLTPRSWSFIGSGGAMLLAALAMVTVTLASTGENPAPPDGALLIPYLVPLALLFFGLGVGGRASNLFRQPGALRKLGAIPVAALAGAFVFVAYEASRFAR
jgi:hypothetical protein